MKTFGKNNSGDKVGKKGFYADQDATASNADGPRQDPTNAQGGGPRRKKGSTFSRGTRAERNERFGDC